MFWRKGQSRYQFYSMARKKVLDTPCRPLIPTYMLFPNTDITRISFLLPLVRTGSSIILIKQ